LHFLLVYVSQGFPPTFCSNPLPVILHVADQVPMSFMFNAGQLKKSSNSGRVPSLFLGSPAKGKKIEFLCRTLSIPSFLLRFTSPSLFGHIPKRVSRNDIPFSPRLGCFQGCGGPFLSVVCEAGRWFPLSVLRRPMLAEGRLLSPFFTLRLHLLEMRVLRPPPPPLSFFP